MPRRRKLMSVVGTRPNFMKIAPVAHALAAHHDGWEHVLVHTGQHYDDPMSRVFLRDLGLGDPDHDLAVGSGSHAQHVARVLERLEPVLLHEQPDVVLVPGDVNSTLGAAVGAAALGFPVGHIEAGLRSFDRTMREEVNRTLVDAVSDLLFTHSPEARVNLEREGRPPAAIHEVGNTMIDTLVRLLPSVEALRMPQAHGLEHGSYLVVTLHRPALVDGELLAPCLEALSRVAEELPVVFPVHPRTRAAIKSGGLRLGAGIRLLGPLGYREFLGLLAGAAGVLTDSGGIQEETTFLGIPCFTLRDNTERPITVAQGTNVLLGLAPERVVEVPRLITERRGAPTRALPGWDGAAGKRIVDVLDRALPEAGQSTVRGTRGSLRAVS